MPDACSVCEEDVCSMGDPRSVSPLKFFAVPDEKRSVGEEACRAEGYAGKLKLVYRRERTEPFPEGCGKFVMGLLSCGSG